jgi:hypothetical protein
MATFNKNYLKQVAKFQKTTVNDLLDKGFPERIIINGYLEGSYAQNAINQFRTDNGIPAVNTDHLVLFLSNPDAGNKKPKAIHVVNSPENVWHLGEPSVSIGADGFPDKKNTDPVANEFLTTGNFWYKLKKDDSWKNASFADYTSISLSSAPGKEGGGTPTPPHRTTRFNPIV